jgi:CMP-N-acetylneuraminic acid synthetase
MIGTKRILAVVPARGGSKGIPLKNLKPVGGVPMVAQVGVVLRDLPAIDRAVVSTDNDEIARVAEGAGIAAPFRRPAGLAGDRVADLDYYDPSGNAVVARHQLKPGYHRNGVAYAITRDCLVNQRSIKGTRTRGLVLDGHFVSIDTEWDIALAEFIMRHQG